MNKIIYPTSNKKIVAKDHTKHKFDVHLQITKRSLIRLFSKVKWCIFYLDVLFWT